MSGLNANATEWRPSGAVMMNLELPPSTKTTTTNNNNSNSSAGAAHPTPALSAQSRPTPRMEPHPMPAFGPAHAAPHASTPMPPMPAAYDAYSMAAAAAAAAMYGGQDNGHGNAHMMMMMKGPPMMADFQAASFMPPFPLAAQYLTRSTAANTSNNMNGGSEADGGNMDLPDLDWAAEFAKVMELTEKMIDQQRNGYPDERSIIQRNHHAVQSALGANAAPVARPQPLQAANATQRSGQATPALSAVSATNNAVGAAANAPREAAEGHSQSNHPSRVQTAGTSPSTTPEVRPRARSMSSNEEDRILPPLTAKGNRRWKKMTKAQQRRDQVQKSAFEAFANALLHSVSPFMGPLRERCKTSLPHIKVDQRFGKNGQPQTAIAQFIVAPLVTNYRPRHFHDLTPGDLMEYHYDMAQVMAQLSSAYCIIIGYGPVWKRYAVPYCYVACREYRKEVLALCPNEVPNSRAEAIYEDDIIKDITEVVLAVEELEGLQRMSIMQAMRKRVNLAPLYDALDAIFRPLVNYRIEIYGLYDTPSTFLLKTSRMEVEEKPHPIVLYNDPKMWDELPSATPPRMNAATTAEGGSGGTPGAANEAASTPATAATATAVTSATVAAAAVEQPMRASSGGEGSHAASQGRRQALHEAAPYTPSLASAQPRPVTTTVASTSAAQADTAECADNATTTVRRVNEALHVAAWREYAAAHRLPLAVGALAMASAVAWGISQVRR